MRDHRLSSHHYVWIPLVLLMAKSQVDSFAFAPPSRSWRPGNPCPADTALPVAQRSKPSTKSQQLQQYYQHSFCPLPAGLVVRATSSSSYSADVLSSNENLIPGIKAINAANDAFLEKLGVLREQPYFRFYSVDLLGSCEYIPQELFECYTESCEIYPADEEEIPEQVRTVDKEQHDYELDGWARWDMPTDDYYDALTFPEGYTGYDGSDVWNFIHNRICFTGYGYGPGGDSDHWKADFNKAVSGLHSMISAQIIQGIQDKIDEGIDFTEDEIWTDPLVEYKRRLGPNGETPLAMENLYFCFMLLLTAANRARERLLGECEDGSMDEDAASALQAVLECPVLDDPSVQIASQRLQDHAVKDSDSVEALWQARMRSRELLRIMNCVQCNKCRFHGKISVLGLTTALQILVGYKGEGSDPTRIHRVQLAALMTTLHKFSRAVQFCQELQMQES